MSSPRPILAAARASEFRRLRAVAALGGVAVAAGALAAYAHAGTRAFLSTRKAARRRCRPDAREGPQGATRHGTGDSRHGSGGERRGRAREGRAHRIWQANTHGRYAHPATTILRRSIRTSRDMRASSPDAEGRYRFKTIKPGAYPAGGPCVRHTSISTSQARGIASSRRCIFPAIRCSRRRWRPAAATNGTADRRCAPADADLEPDSLLANWDIVLENG